MGAQVLFFSSRRTYTTILVTKTFDMRNFGYHNSHMNNALICHLRERYCPCSCEPSCDCTFRCFISEYRRRAWFSIEMAVRRFWWELSK